MKNSYTTSLLDTAVCILPCFQCLLHLMASISKKCQHWKAGVGYKVPAAIYCKAFCELWRGRVQKKQQLDGDKSKKVELSVCV